VTVGKTNDGHWVGGSARSTARNVSNTLRPATACTPRAVRLRLRGRGYWAAYDGLGHGSVRAQVGGQVRDDGAHKVVHHLEPVHGAPSASETEQQTPPYRQNTTELRWSTSCGEGPRRREPILRDRSHTSARAPRISHSSDGTADYDAHQRAPWHTGPCCRSSGRPPQTRGQAQQRSRLQHFQSAQTPRLHEAIRSEQAAS
jgi:hypothetical protein